MPLKFWDKPGPQGLPDRVKNALISQFGMTPESVGKMRFLGLPGNLADQKVEFIRVFDPALVSGGAESKAKYQNFELQFSGDRKALLFEGHLEEDGSVWLNDRRPSKTYVAPTETPAALEG